MGLLHKIFEEVNLRFFNYSSHPDFKNQEKEAFIENALYWLKNSAEADGKFSSKYSMLWNKYFPPLPESVAGWITTLMQLKKQYPQIYSKIFKERNVENEMAEWLLSEQRPDGTFAASYEDAVNQPPSIFVNGAVISGLISHYEVERNEKTLQAILKSADWLLQMQMDNGNWKYYTFNVPYVNSMSAFALIRLGKIISDEKYITAGKKNIEYIISVQQPNGYFFPKHSPQTNSAPRKDFYYTDAIAFTLMGILFSSNELNDGTLTENVSNGFKPVLHLLSRDGYLPGEINDSFQTTVNYCCLPGNCLLSSVGAMLYRKTKNELFKTASEKLLDYVKEKQLRSRYTYLAGGITGSWPLSGKYNPYEINSSAIKYFVDALMEQPSANF